ncbi:alpha/beta fold hydrolase [Panacagrimonas sp.]|uniref:alpha/beta fold hydrolase n=1 Tax=Panacagrimonas sp. TaxID=2480088 RepID=UPI003B51E174
MNITLPASVLPVEQSYFFHGHYRLAFETHGPASGTTVILVHGILLDSYCNRDIAAHLAAEGYRVILLDLLGHGRSDKPVKAAEHRVDFYAEQVLGLMDHLGLERAVLGGVSLGAITALTAACLAPHRVRALILEMPVMENAVPAAALMLVPLMIAVHYITPAYRVFARLLRRLPEPRRAVMTSLRNAFAAEPEVIRAILHGILVGPVVPSLRRRKHIQQPTLVIGHARDPLHDLADAKALKRQLPNAEILAARSIWELRTQPERLMPQILDFLRRVPAETDRAASLRQRRAANG